MCAITRNSNLYRFASFFPLTYEDVVSYLDPQRQDKVLVYFTYYDFYKINQHR